MLIKKTELTGRSFSLKFRMLRVVWIVVNFLCLRYSPKPFFKYRNFFMRLFGAKIAQTARVNQTAEIWYPGHLSLGENSAIGFGVVLYNQGQVDIGDNVIISQYAYVCASTHDYHDPLHPLVLAPISISNHVWVCADSFIGPGVTLAEGGVMGARSVIIKDTLPWGVYAGNPAVNVKKRTVFK